jgi:hypothetical protein
MTEIRNEARLKGRLLSRIRAMFEHRAEWLFLLLDEARKRGFSWDDFAPAAIHRCGLFHGAALARGAIEEEGLLALRKKLFSGMGKRVFEMEVKRSEKDELRVEFHYCPLVSAWKKLGASDEDIGKLCDIAMRGDAGIAESFGARLELGEVLSKGGRVCALKFYREAART